MLFHALFVTDRCPGGHIISNCVARPTSMNSGIIGGRPETQKFVALAVAHNSMSIGCNLFKLSVVVLLTTKEGRCLFLNLMCG